jgi:nucleotide-binding universal stress UspA family protein
MRVQNADVFKSILVPIDEHESPDELLRIVGDLAKAFNSQVTVLHLRERRVTVATTIEAETIRQATDFTQSIVDRLAADGIEASGQVDSVRPDYVGPRILEAANDVFADLIVVGGHHHDTVKERLLGDLGKTLAHGARCPVLMLPSIGM